MEKTTRALILSALVLPGAGQWFLHRYKSSLVFMGVSIAAVGVLVVKLFTIALQVAEQIIQGQITPDFWSLHQLIKTELYASSVFNWVLGVLIIMWLFSIVDILRLKWR